ncbi:MAG TPA: alanine--tRNA ligase, partial [Chromatiales bacterium]|nr:alanine--tRNA ligase [Chromatiales bacterium]
NLVFMQYDRDREGNLNPLPRPSVDTGMGLERLAAIMQGVHSNYEIDLFRRLIGEAARLAGTDDLDNPSLKVIADHIRSCSFLIADGVMPANEGRGYVLRRIIRRAARHGHKLGLREPFFHRLVAPLVAEMGAAYPVLAERQAEVERVLRQEEERFAETLEKGLRLLEDAIERMSGDTIPGETVFRLYDTYGFPVDLTADIARERGLKIDEAGFEREMAAQRERARAASSFDADYTEAQPIDTPTEFTGYDRDADAGRVLALFVDGKAVDEIHAGQEGRVILDRTPFYAESGGQVGDTGVLEAEGARFEVLDTQKQGQAHAHIGRMAEGSLRRGDVVTARIDSARRQAIRLNHSATHLLHAALRRVLGEHVQQKGSLVNDERLRFDFAHFEPMTREQIEEVERLVNEQIRLNAETEAAVMSMDEAMKTGAMALFGEKYGDRVRVMKIGFSTELCGGTHVARTGDIGLFKIVSEGGIASGVRRIEALTGAAALAWVEAEDRLIDELAGLVKAPRSELDDKVAQLLERNRDLERELERLKAKLAAAAGSDLAGQAVEVAGIRVLAAKIDGADVKTLRETLDQLKNRLGQAAIVLATECDGKAVLVAGVTRGETDRIKAGELVNFVAGQVGGKGGGRPDMAQAGGSQPEKLPEALSSVPEWVAQKLSG